MKIDLHNHSFYSDGLDSINSLNEKAIHNGVDIFALTDHDSVIGTLDITPDLRSRIIPGIELSTTANGESVHLVGLFKNGYIPESMFEFSRNFLKARKERAIKMMAKIEEIYHLKTDIADLLKDADRTAVTRGNMLRNIAKTNNISLERAAFYISNQSEAYIPMSKTPVSEGIKFLKNNNCLVILAHPTLLKPETLNMIINLGLDGIEARYPLNKKGDEAMFKRLARNFNLFISAGSDCHGDKTHSDIGTATLDAIEFKEIAEKLNYDLEERRWK